MPRRHKHWYHQTRYTVYILAFIGILLLTACWKIQELGINLQVADLTERTYASQGQALQSVRTQNNALKAKLEASARISVDDRTREIVRAYTCQYFGSQCEAALQIAKCESGWSPQALNQNTNGSQDRGVFQINSVHAAQFVAVTGHPYEIFAHDPSDNIKFAKWLYDHSGFEPWVCSRILNT